MAATAAATENKSIVSRVRDKLQGPAKEEKDPWGRISLPSGDIVTPAVAKLLSQRRGSEFVGFETRVMVTVRSGAGRSTQMNEPWDADRHNVNSQDSERIVPGSKHLELLEYLTVPGSPDNATPASVPGQLRPGQVDRAMSFWRAKDGGEPAYVGFAIATACLKRCSKTGKLALAGLRLFLAAPETAKTIAEITKEAEDDKEDAEQQ